MADRVILSVGTKRGLFLMESGKSRKRWTTTGPFLKGWAVHHAMIDNRGRPRLHVAAEHYAYGNSVFSGDIAGRKLTPSEKPPVAPKFTPKQVWLIQPGGPREKKVLYAGTAPAGLFRSADQGKTWDPVDALNKHRTRKDWGPGAGGMSLHSIQVDPHDSKRMYVAISAAGAFRTDDGGKRWKPINSCVADYVGAPEESAVGT